MRGLSFAPRYSERIVIVVRPGHPLIEAPDIVRLAEFPVLLPDRGAPGILLHAPLLRDDRVPGEVTSVGLAPGRRGQQQRKGGALPAAFG